MGKRKRATKPPPKRKSAKLEKIFDCPFCGHEKTVDCVLERDINIGKVECRICTVKYSTHIHRLEEEIDVYSKWIDACEAANNPQLEAPITPTKGVAVSLRGDDAHGLGPDLTAAQELREVEQEDEDDLDDL